MRNIFVTLFICIIAVSLAGIVPVFGEEQKPSGASGDPSISGAVAPGQHKAGPIDKAQRGFNNAAFGWTEIPRKIVDKTKETQNPFAGLLIGGWQGSCKAFARTASGASELVTFPIGRYDKPQVLPDMPAVEK